MTSPVVSDSSPVTGTQFTLSLTVRNEGDGAASATTLRYYRSTDAAITTADTDVATGALAELAASGSASDSVELTAPATPGMYYYGACVDAVEDETDPTNNCSASVQVTVQVTATQSQGHPDLTLTSVSVSDSRGCHLGARCCGKRRRFGGAGRAGDFRDVLPRCVRGRGDR